MKWTSLVRSMARPHCRVIAGPDRESSEQELEKKKEIKQEQNRKNTKNWESKKYEKRRKEEKRPKTM